MIDHKDTKITILDNKRTFLIEKINAYFKQVTEHKTNPTKTKKELIESFNNQIDEALKIFK